MKSIEESVVTAMDGSDIELFPFLPYILQDVWEIGSDPELIINLIKKQPEHKNFQRVLDLGCGKGTVSIKIAKEFGYQCFGIDAVPEFINYAKKKAIEFKVQHLCTFESADIREKVKNLPEFDTIILGSIGPVFGDFYTTMTTLSPYLRDNGIIILDDGYIENDSEYSHPLIYKRVEVLRQVESTGMKIVDEKIAGKESIKESDDYIFDFIKMRCEELIEKYPEKQHIFTNYIKKQQKENDVLENKKICSTMIIKKKSHISDFR